MGFRRRPSESRHWPIARQIRNHCTKRDLPLGKRAPRSTGAECKPVLLAYRRRRQRIARGRSARPVRYSSSTTSCGRLRLGELPRKQFLYLHPGRRQAVSGTVIGLQLAGHSSRLTVIGTQNVVTETSLGWLSAVSATDHRTLRPSLTLLATTDSLLVRCLVWVRSLFARFIATLRSRAMFLGPWSVRIRDWSSLKPTSRHQWSSFSMDQ